MGHSSLSKLSSCLGEASEFVKKILDEDSASSKTSRPETSSSSGNRVFSALQRARSKLNSSQSSVSGLGKRLIYELPVQQMTKNRGKELRRKN